MRATPISVLKQIRGELGGAYYEVCFDCVSRIDIVRRRERGGLMGHYRYEQYAVTVPDGRVLHLKDLGASEAFLDISDTGITLRMTMLAGNALKQTAKVLDAHFDKGTGYWVAQWADMKGPVRANVTLVGDVLTSHTQFDNKADLQYGSSEHAVLRKVSGN
jgi:hypothetical protein